MARRAGTLGGWLAAATLVALAACERPGPGTPARSLAQLQQNLARAPGFEVFVGGEDARSPVEVAAGVLAARSGREVRVLSLDASGDPRWPRVVIGLFDAPELGPLLDRLGARVDPELGKRSYLGMALGGAGDALCATFEDPERPGLPLLLFAVGAEASLARLAGDLRFPPRPVAEVFSGAAPAFRVELGLDGRALLATREETALRRAELLSSFSAAGGRRPDARAQGSPGLEQRAARVYLDLVQGARQRARAFCGVDAPGAPWRAVLASRSDEMLALTGRVSLSRAPVLREAATALLAPSLPSDAGAVAAREEALDALGAPADPWLLDGLAIDAAGRWWGQPLHVADGARRRWIPPLAEVLDPASVDRISVHVLAPARALLFRFLREREGLELVRAVWRGERAFAPDEAFEREFRAWADPRGLEDAPPRETPTGEAGRLDGVAIDSRPLPGGSLAGPALEESLRRAIGAGARTVSFTTYYADRAPDPRTPCAPLALGRESLEGDAALAVGVAAARRAGAERVVLQPRLLSAEGGGLAAWRKRTTRAEWAELFDGLDAMLLHYAHLAELLHCDVLVLGTEAIAPADLVGSPPELLEYRRERRRAAVRIVRAVYSGELTYAARWPAEAAAIDFWEELDYVGLTLYLGVPFREGARPRRQELESRLWAQLAGAARFAEERGRPLLVLEAGYRATRDAVREPELGAGPLDLAEQARAIEALSAAIDQARRATGQPAGVIAWYWGVEPGDGGARDRGFSLRDKPAEAALWYRDR